jgi:hypothetical protein
MNRILVFCIFIIGLVSVFDTYLLIIYSPYLRQFEQNPLGQYLLDVGGLTLFVEAKALATLLVVGLSFYLLKTRWRWAIYGVLVFQISLFVYLNFYTFSGFDFDWSRSPLLDLLDYHFNPDRFPIEPYLEEDSLFWQKKFKPPLDKSDN